MNPNSDGNEFIETLGLEDELNEQEFILQPIYKYIQRARRHYCYRNALNYFLASPSARLIAGEIEVLPGFTCRSPQGEKVLIEDEPAYLGHCWIFDNYLIDTNKSAMRGSHYDRRRGLDISDRISEPMAEYLLKLVGEKVTPRKLRPRFGNQMN